MGKLVKINASTTTTDNQRKEAESYTARKGTLVKIGSPSASTTQTGTQSAPRSAGMSTENGSNIRISFGGLKNDTETQNKLARERKMGVGESWKDTAGSYAIKSGLAGSAAGLVNAAGTALKSDRKSGLAVDSGDVKPETTGNEWYNRAGAKLQNTADKVQAYSDDAYTKGTEGLNTAQKLLFDVAKAGTEMAADVGLGLLTGGAAIPMAVRGFGSGSMQARKEGASENEQIFYGAASAAVEALTEKMFDGVAKIYGKGMADDAVQKFAEKIAKTPQGQSFVRALAGMGGEGLEEMISGVVDPALQTIYNGKKLGGGAYDGMTMGDILYQGAVGALMGVVGGATDIAQTVRGNKKSSQTGAANETAKVEQPVIPAAAKTQQAAGVKNSGAANPAKTAQQQQQTADVTRLLTPEEHVAKMDDEAVERILEAFTVDDGYVSKQRQEQLIHHHGEDLFYRAVEEGFNRGIVTNDAAGNIYSLKPETRKPGYYGSNGKEAKYLDSLAKAANMTILRGDLENGQMGFYINGRAVLAKNAGVEIARHEVAHHLKQAAPEEFGAFLDYAKGVYGEKLGDAMETIRNDYAQRGEVLSDEVAEEELAAYYAGQLMTDETAMKRLAGENLSLAERILDWLKQSLAKLRRAFGGEDVETKQLREAAELFENAIRAAKSGTVESDSVRHAIETLPDGKQYVRADRQVIFGNDPESWKEQLQNYINGKIRQGQDVTLIGADGDELLLTKDSAGKLSDNHTSDGRTMSDDAYERKANAAAHIDELAQVSRRGKQPKKDHDARHGDMASGGWDYRTAYFEDFDGSYYLVTISAAISKDGKMIYNVRETKKEAHPKIRGSSANSGNGLRGFASSATSIPTSAGKSNTQNSGKRSAYADTAEQLQEIQRLQRQNERLEEQMWNLRNRVQGVPLAGTDRVSTRKQVLELKKRYGSRVDTNAVTDAVVELYDGIMERRYSNEEMRQKAREIADRIIDGAAVQSNPMYEEYEDLRKGLRKSRVFVPVENRADLEQMGGYNALRQKNMGRMIFSDEGTPVDVLYEDLSERYPGLFPDDIYNPADQIVQISDVLDELGKVMTNPFEVTPQAREYLAGDILERYFDTPQTYEAQLQRDRARAAEQMRKMQQTHKQQLDAMERRHAAENRERRERATASERRKQLLTGTERMTKKLVHPDDKRHIPAELKETVRAFVSMVNTESGYEYVYQRDGTYKRVKAGTEPFGMTTARTDRARELMAELQKLKRHDADPNAAEGESTPNTLHVDPALQANLDKIVKLGEMKVADMDRGQIDLFYETMRSIEKMCQNHDKMLGDSKYATVSKAANALWEENQSRRAKTQWNEKVQWIDDMAEIEMMTPETFFHKMGKAGDELFRQMRRSADKQTRILKEGVEHAKSALDKSGLNVKELEKETHKFELESGETLTMTTAQIMNLHALWKREQARDHIGLGGIKPTKIDSGKGLKATAAVAAEKVTLNDLGNILKVLTPQQKAFVDELQKFMAGSLANHGNEASRAVYGYDKFTERDYWPIRVNKAEVESDPAKAAAAKTIVGFGMAKAPKPKASNGLEVGSFMDVYTQHLSEMATYASWLATSENLTRVNNFKFTDAEGKPTGQTVKTLLEKIYGRGGDGYWQKLMGDIAQGTKAGSDGTEWDWITANTKAAAVGANLRVVLQQPTSILRAMNMVHPKYFTKKGSMAAGKGWEKALQYSGIAQWKDWGYFEMDTGRSVRGLITGPESKVEQLREASMAAAGKADSVTWGVLWNAVENETRERLQMQRKTAEKYNELVGKPDMPVSKLAGNPDGLSYAELKTRAMRKAADSGWFDRPHGNRDTGVKVFVSKDAYTHAFSNLTAEWGEDTILAMEHLPELIENAVLTDSRNPKDPGKAETKVHTLFAAVRGKNGVEPVKLTVKEYKTELGRILPKNVQKYFRDNGMQDAFSKLYDVVAIEPGIKKEPDASGKVYAKRHDALATSNSKISVADLIGLVNGEARKHIPQRPAAIPEDGSDAFYELVAERFGEVIDRTQVVDSVLHRSQIMRKGGLNKMATSFMSEPMKTYNMVMREIYDVNAAPEGEAKNRAKKRLARTASALTVSFAMNAVAQSIADAMRDDDREKDYWEKFFENWTENFADNFNVFNYVPYAKDIVSVISGYDVSRMDMDAISDVKQAADQLAKAIKGTGKKTVANAGVDMANEFAAIFGLPMANIKRDLLGVVNTAFSEAGAYRMQYELDKMLYDIDYSGSRVRWWKILYAASQDNWDDYEAIYNDMLNQGLTDEQIKKGMENQMKAAQGVSSVKELKYRWTPPKVRSEFNTFSKQISETEGPRKALDLGWW